jgi:hypothetical protein
MVAARQPAAQPNCDHPWFDGTNDRPAVTNGGGGRNDVDATAKSAMIAM